MVFNSTSGSILLCDNEGDKGLEEFKGGVIAKWFPQTSYKGLEEFKGGLRAKWFPQTSLMICRPCFLIEHPGNGSSY